MEQQVGEKSQEATFDWRQFDMPFKDPAKRREWQKKYKQEHVEQEKEAGRCYREAHRKELNEKARRYAREHRAERTIYMKKYVQEHPEKMRCTKRNHNWKTNGVDMDTDRYEVLLHQQGGVCAICGGVDRERNLAVDHDHSTGEVRGLLCGNCNSRVLPVVEKFGGRIMDYLGAQ